MEIYGSKPEIVAVIDQDEEWASTLGSLLKSEGYGVLPPIMDGMTAIDCIHKERPDILIMDVLLPIYDGFYVIQYIRDHYVDYSPFIYIVTDMRIEWMRKLPEGFGYLSVKPQLPKAVLKNLQYFLRADTMGLSGHEPVEFSFFMDRFIEKLTGTYWKKRDLAAKAALSAMLENPDIRQLTNIYELASQSLDCTSIACERNLRFFAKTVREKRMPFYLDKVVISSCEDDLRTNYTFYFRLIQVLRQEIALYPDISERWRL